MGAMPPAPSAASRRRRSAAPAPNMGSLTVRSRGFSTPPEQRERVERLGETFQSSGSAASSTCSGFAIAQAQVHGPRPAHNTATPVPEQLSLFLARTAAHTAHGQQERHDLQQVLVDLRVAQAAVLRKQRLGRLVRLRGEKRGGRWREC